MSAACIVLGGAKLGPALMDMAQGVFVPQRIFIIVARNCSDLDSDGAARAGSSPWCMKTIILKVGFLEEGEEAQRDNDYPACISTSSPQQR